MNASAIYGQGTITFNSGSGFNGTDYHELGIRFHVLTPISEPYHDWLVGIPAPPGPANMPQNSTPYIAFLRQNSQYNYVSLSLPGYTFGLTSIQLADPSSPSFSALSISFVGYMLGGDTITNTFTTPGNGATTFATYTFSSEFAAPVFTHVDILAPRWAMDNLVFTVPEPAAGALLGLGALMVGLRRGKHRRKL